MTWIVAKQVIIVNQIMRLYKYERNSAERIVATHSKLTNITAPIAEFVEVAAGLPLDIMQGPNDPANFSLPRKLFICLFPGLAAYNTFRSFTNPHSFEIDNIGFHGTSGQNIDDLEKYSDAKDKLEFMERTLRWRHLAPRAPNTVGCYPYTDRDPFFTESCPHLYFAGIIKGSEGQFGRLISVPKFSESGIAVVVSDNEDCNISSIFEEACDFIDYVEQIGQKVLVKEALCF
ncbi:DNA polymerase delta small subunit-like [Arachis stenosperma]|uniref:DNA polymerase delta small subunit-like n=1 Tax=Arachis stenosperma TaxID=217475 RepID=UPI0025ACEF14|nr:DNA polymerase delta small subunit-like [Arachis stenosperma]